MTVFQPEAEIQTLSVFQGHSASPALPRRRLWHCRLDLDLTQHPARQKPVPHPVQRPPPIFIALSGGCDLFRMRPPRDWASQHLHRSPLAARFHPLGADYDGCRPLPMLVVLGVHRYATWDDALHPVRRHACTRQFGDLYRHADATEVIGHACDGGGDHLSIGMGVARDIRRGRCRKHRGRPGHRNCAGRSRSGPGRSSLRAGRR